ncbi:MAG: helix-turn-helix domain-containing protein [bacterium]|nr:helix-turn-helix domain-containing protein [bacterium]
MDILSALQELGFTEYEAKVYCALVRHPGITGYEAGRHSGVPRARVYEVLEGLVHRGAALVQTADGKQIYHPVEHRLLLAGHRERLQQLMTGLATRLDRLAARSDDPQFLVIRDREAIISRCRHLCAQPGSRLFVSGWPEDLALLGPDFCLAEERGVGVWVLAYGDVDLPVKRLFRHSVSPLQYVQVAAWGRWLTLVAGLDQGLVAQFSGPGRTVGMWTTAPALVFALAAGIQHDMYAHAVLEEVGPGALAALSPGTRQLLAELWTWEPAAAGAAVPAGLTVTSFFEDLRQRLQLDPTLARDIGGCYEFRLASDQTYHVDLRGGRIDVGPGPAPDPGLVVRMSAADLLALAGGTLPPGAVYERDRIQVTGAIEQAARLQTLLGG